MLLDGCEVFNCEQGTPEWHQARCGIVTASTFSDVLAGGKGITRTKLLYSVAAERITGQATPSWSGNAHSERGHALEPEIRALYEATSPEDVTQVGFIRRGRIGCSPDACVGEDGGLEIKTKLPHLQIEALEKGTLPSDHVAQVQGILLVTGWKFCDFRSYWPGLPQLKVRVYRDLDYLSRLSTELARFHNDVDAIVAKYGSN